jgi:hypothetical protein
VATHAVQFYEEDSYLAAVVADFFAGAIHGQRRPAPPVG